MLFEFRGGDHFGITLRQRRDLPDFRLDAMRDSTPQLIFVFQGVPSWIVFVAEC
jgi:hypothetical protein